MKLTTVFEPAKEGGYTCFVEEIPAAISQGETLEEAKANLLDALKLVLECQRELAEKELSPEALRETIEFAGTWGWRIWSGTSRSTDASSNGKVALTPSG